MFTSLFQVLFLIATCWPKVDSCLRSISNHENLIHDKGFENLYRTNKEEVENVPIHFDKPIPRWITGTLIKNGPSQFEVGKRKFTHMFDGFGKLYSWRFQGNGSVFFSAKFMKSEFYKKSVSKNDISAYLMFGPTQPRFSYLQVALALWRGMDNMNVNVYRFPSEKSKQGHFISITDIWNHYEIDPLSLETIRYQHPTVPSTGGIAGFLYTEGMSTAHPLPEHGTSNHFTFLFSLAVVPGLKHRFSLIRIKSNVEQEVVTQWSVNTDELPFMHSFSVTPNYVIFFRPPLFVNSKVVAVSGFVSKAMKWHGAKKDTIIYVVEIKSGIIRTFSAPPVLYLHQINAFETQRNEIIVDIPTYKDPSIIFKLNMNALLNRTKRNKFYTNPVLTRYVIDLNESKVSVRKFPESVKYPCVTKLDMPIINENYRSRNYCYVYGLVPKWDDKQYSHFALVKKDLCSNGKDRMWFIPNHYPMEAWFIPFPEDNRNNTREDNGYLMVPVLDGEKNTSYLAVIDAATMTTYNKAYLPTRVPITFHGRFFPDIK
ncbi:beta,beta-carotene 15,15'-dioxygenase-like [Mizuhopecten yessoensis]|uniref:beta,beta-carotene 15,15'-dioxygenase-like n=1 Tax=Mizuhopecten yessoensis TaxID=6573 RepID=UPI000B45E072|nr:beta,beta-carotene 15,15'-dioxygenase-like [Mizuhopecten yessoensis]